ncbi:hypothetical protein [Novosphingobium sp. 9U]|uniref:hypothetical protein n=1 Tax=Novosphingobium sp. 9U TaxID=2653158 RepID=UPI0012F2C196|nr:hypothetical protein [Novosphingobium sp. 9U]VWX50141.1 conserved hypothetical protein [Novosphingobium sp. 9U]
MNATLARPEFVTGSRSCLEIPTTLDAFEKAGPTYLTELFRASGAIGHDNAVVAIEQWEPFEAGGMGPKLRFDVRYAQEEPGLHRALFAKLPRPFGDPLRELFAPVVEPEIRLYQLTRNAAFPVAVPKLYFGDYDPQTASSLLITERIRFGESGIEPCHDKCLDNRLADPLPYYEALTRAGARLSGSHRAGLLGPSADEAFPFDPDAVDVGAAIPYTPEQLAAKMDVLLAFAAEAPQLFPEGLADPELLHRFASDAMEVLGRERELRRVLNTAPDYVALCHWNLNLDNAWFEPAPAGGLSAGLLDWGATAQMNLGQSLYGMLCAAECEFLAKHRDGLIQLWAEEYRAAGGPAIAVKQLHDYYALSVALLGVAWIIDAPSIVMAQLPEYRELSGREDPRLEGNFLGRAQRQLLMVLLSEWRELEIGRLLHAL